MIGKLKGRPKAQVENRLPLHLEVLLVEDDPEYAFLIREQLRLADDHRVAVTHVQLLSEALNVLARSSFHAILLALDLPDTTGLSAVTHLHEISGNRTPILVLTGCPCEDLAVAAQQAGAEDYLVKGEVEGAVLMRSIRYAMGRRQARYDLERASREWLTTFDAMNDTVLLLDRDQRVVRCNRAARDILGNRDQELVGRLCSDVVGGGHGECPESCPFVRMCLTRQRENAIVRRGARSFRATVDPLVTTSGELVGAVYVLADVTEQRVAEERSQLAVEALELLNRPDDASITLHNLLVKIRDFTGMDAVGIRLKEGRDYPYYETTGFEPEFVALENSLCSRDRNGSAILDEQGQPLLDCICGRVIRGAAEALPYGATTPGGSFWTNSTTELVGGDMSCESGFRGRCQERGYESVALIPLRSTGETVGLLQLSDRSRGCLTLDMIEFFERIGNSIGIAVARRRAAQALAERERYLRTIWNSVENGILLVDGRTRRIVDANAAAVRMLGGAFPQVVGQPRETFLPGASDWGAARESGEREGHGCEDEVVTVTGRRFPVLRTTCPVELDNKRMRLESLVDITEKRNLEAQLRQQQKLQAIGTLASGVAHEINNPINGIMNYAQLLKDAPEIGGHLAGYADEIIHETDRVATIVRNLLTFARQEKPERECVNIRDVIQSTLSLVGTTIRHDQIALELRMPESLPCARCCPQQIQQIVMNLVTNARDALNDRYPGYSPAKMIRISAQKVSGKESAKLRITVEDRAGGIPTDMATRVFDPFFTTKGRDRGTGLGLSISHGIAKDHQGDLWLEAEPGSYTRFHLDLPCEDDLRVPDGATRE